jgi:RNA polymerase sigma factor FliA
LSNADFTFTAQTTALDRNEISTSMTAELTAGEAFETDALVARRELRNVLEAAMQSLPRRDQQIMALYHWRGCTMREIGRLFNINESRVSQIHKRALGHLAVTLRASGIVSSSSIMPR